MNLAKVSLKDNFSKNPSSSSGTENSLDLKMFEEWKLTIGKTSFIEKILHKISYVVWRQHKRLVTLYSKKTLRGMKRDPGFMKNDFKIGVLSPATLKLLRDCIERSPTVSKNVGDHIPGYYFDKYRDWSDVAWRDGFRWLNLRGEAKHIEKIFESVASEIKACFGYPFRIVNVNGWGTKPSAVGLGANAWHSDGFPPGIYKLLFYLGPADKNKGSTEIRLPDGSSKVVEGPAGTWLLFNSTAITHRGLPAISDERVIINATIVPAFKESCCPIFAGLNANFPFFPWSAPNGNL